jgi:hypothetical protein
MPTTYFDGARTWDVSDSLACRVINTREWICPICDIPVGMFDLLTGTGFLSRICGDSANGYEAYHKACCVEDLS